MCKSPGAGRNVTCLRDWKNVSVTEVQREGKRMAFDEAGKKC